MCNKIIAALVALCLGISTHAQKFQHVYHSTSIDFLQSVEQLSDNGYLLSGYTNGSGGGGNDALLIRTDEFGEKVWSKSMGSVGSENFSTTAALENGMTLVSGSTQSTSETGIPDGFIAAIDGEGEVVWTTVFKGDFDDKVRDIKVLEDGSIIVTGLTNSYNTDNSYDVFLAQLDAEGNMLWNKVYGTPMYDVPLALEVSDDGEIFVWGHQEGTETAGYDAFLLKTDDQGNILWNNRYGLEDNELAWGMEILPDGSLIISGDTSSAGEGLNDIFVLHMDTDGNLDWAKTYGGFSHDHGIEIKHYKNNLFVIGGATGSLGAGGMDFLNLFVKTTGEVKYAVAFGGDSKEILHGFTVTNDFGVAMVGETRSFGEGFYSGLFVKTDHNGQCGCNDAYSTSLVANDIEFEIGSAGFEVRGEGMVSEAGAFLISYADAVSQTTLCSSLPPFSEVGEDLPNENEDEILNETHSQLRLFPNPSTGPVMASIRSAKEENTTLTVFDMSGSVVYQDLIPTGIGTTTLSLPNLATGIYLARVNAGSHTETKRLIVE